MERSNESLKSKGIKGTGITICSKFGNNLVMNEIRMINGRVIDSIYNSSNSSRFQTWNHISRTSSRSSHTLPDLGALALFRNHFWNFPTLFQTWKHCKYQKCFDKFA